MSVDRAIAALLLNGGVVFFIGMLAGLPYAILRIRKTDAEAEENWRVSHVQNIQNGFLLLLVGACTPHLWLSTSATQAMVYLLVVAAYCDMIAWAIRPLTGHAGLLPDPPAANRVVFAFFAVTASGQFAGMALVIYGAWARYAGLGT